MNKEREARITNLPLLTESFGPAQSTLRAGRQGMLNWGNGSIYPYHYFSPGKAKYFFRYVTDFVLGNHL
jgi:hypothetical protein